MNAKSIFEEISRLVANSSSVAPSKRGKLTGAVTIEVIRDRLIRARLPISPRDVFIKGSPTEFDTLVVRPTAKAVCGILYEPFDVAAVLEIKYSGVFSADVLPRLRHLFDSVKLKHPHIQCIYLTLCENPKFRHKMTSEALGSPAFTLYWWTNYKKTDVRPGDGLDALVACLQEALSRLPQGSVENCG